MGYPNRGDGLARKPEVKSMRWKPVVVTFTVKRTRMGWQISIRVQFAH